MFWKTIRSQKGFSLVEVTGAMAILAILSASSVKGYGWVQTSKVTATIEQLRTIRLACQNWKAVGGSSDYTGLGSSGVSKLQVLRLLNAGDSSNSFGGGNEATAGFVTGTLLVTSDSLDTEYGPLVASGANTVFGSSVCSHSGSTVTCTFTE